jgi:vancomycin permeability regulator SanA
LVGSFAGDFNIPVGRWTVAHIFDVIPMFVTRTNLIAILGSPNDENGKLSEMGERRIRLGYEIHMSLRNEGSRLLLTGGYGHHFNTTIRPHAFYAKERLLLLGVPQDEIVEFALSRNTVDDALQARPIVERYAPKRLIVVSSDFHMERVRFVFEHVFPGRELQFFGAPYLEACVHEERERLLAHESRELTSLRDRGESIVGGVLRVDS